MHSNSNLSKFTVVGVLISILILGFSCFGLILLFDRRYLLPSDYDLVFFFGAFSVVALSLISIFITLLAHRTNKTMYEELEILHSRIAEMEKKQTANRP